MNKSKWSDTNRQKLDKFNQIMMNYQELVYNQACWMLGDPQEAEDITQEVFITAYQKFDEDRLSSIKSWLMRITTNRCIDELRTRKRRPVLSLQPEGEDGEEFDSPYWLEDPSPCPEKAMEQAQMRQMLERQISSLPVDMRTAVVMVDVLELDYQEAADALSVPIGTLKSRLARARERLCRSIRSTGWAQNEVVMGYPEKAASVQPAYRGKPASQLQPAFAS